jgi:hypothetical protein
MDSHHDEEEEVGQDKAHEKTRSKKPAVVSPDEESQKGRLGNLANPTWNTKSVDHFFRTKERTPPKDSEKVILADMIADAEKWLSFEWKLLSDEQQLRLCFIMVREYLKYLRMFFASNLAFLPLLLYKQGFETPEQAVLASHQNDTKCGK